MEFQLLLSLWQGLKPKVLGFKDASSGMTLATLIYQQLLADEALLCCDSAALA